MTFASRFAAFTGFVGVVCAASGCTESTSDADRFREAVPRHAEVALNVPGSTTGGTTTKSARSGLRIQTDHETGGATSYRFTRAIAGAVDLGTAVILGSIWAVVNTEPTSLEANKAVWGPASGGALEPVVWRFTVTDIGDREYDYVLEGQLKSGGEWLPVIHGHGYGKSRPEHRQGWFSANNDNLKKLDPNATEAGTTKITYDLAKLPATIDVELRPDPAEGALDIGVRHEADGAGRVAITGTIDLDEDDSEGHAQLEDVELLSRWASSGAGRSQWTFSGGDLRVPTVTASECWSPAFARVYYADSVDYEPASGDEAACAFRATDL